MAMTLGHVALNVRDLTRSIAFYTEILDLELVREAAGEGRRYAFLGADGRVDVTLWEQADAAFDAARAGLHHLAFAVADMAAVERVAARLRARGVEIRSDTILAHREGAGSGGVFFPDPDGLRLEVFSPQGAEAYAAPAEGPACGFF